MCNFVIATSSGGPTGPTLWVYLSGAGLGVRHLGGSAGRRYLLRAPSARDARHAATPFTFTLSAQTEWRGEETWPHFGPRPDTALAAIA